LDEKRPFRGSGNPKAQEVLSVEDNSARRLLDRLANRIVKILNETRKLSPPEK
jgi:hypothetical protein